MHILYAVHRIRQRIHNLNFYEFPRMCQPIKLFWQKKHQEINSFWLIEKFVKRNSELVVGSSE